MGSIRKLVQLIAVALLVAFGASAAEDDILTKARELATSKHRPEALSLLQSHLQESPSDVDARLLLGLILSWEGRYDEARVHLGMVLAGHPTYTDARLALINVELWSDNPERAEALAAEGIKLEPDNAELRVRHAKALQAMNRGKDAVQELGQAVKADPNNTQAREMRDSARDEIKPWTATFYHSFDGFPNDGGEPWEEYQMQLSRATPLGSVFARYSRADRFGMHSNMSEIDFYPHIRTGTYAYVNVGYSPDRTLYPHYRTGFDLYQSLGRGYEASGGLRRLVFSSPINIYTGSVGKYIHSWLFTGRGYFTPDKAGTSVSGQLIARRFIGEQGDYIGFRASRGSSPEIENVTDLAILNSTSGYFEFSKTLARVWIFGVRAGYSREDRLGLATLNRISVISSLGVRF